MTQIDRGTIHYRDELYRKLIHLTSLSIPTIYYFISRELALKILIPLTVFFIVSDLTRYLSPSFGKLFYFLFGFLLRDHERDNKKRNLNGATYVLISAVASILIFPKIFFVTAFAVLIISDSSAALIGRRWGKNKFLSKSLEGTLTFFVTGCLVVLVSPKINGKLIEYMIGFFAVAIGAIAENVSYGWADDNLTIPLSVGFVMWGLYYLFLPNLSLVLTNVPL
ncbi:MAG: dolichol kinase [Ignavibacteriales bacterium]|nr:dolichol kinase [Ignavibacteriales bacterium]